MENVVTFYTHPMSRGRIAHWMLEETSAPYETKLLSFDKRENKDPKFLSINPMGKLPAIVHRGVVVTETAAIITYLADSFPKTQLAPAVNAPERGAYYRWMFFGATCAEPAIIDKMLNRPSVERTSALSYGTFNDAMSTLEKATGDKPFLLGDHFTAADLYLSSIIGFGFMTKALESSATFQKYIARCTDRPAYQRVIKQSEEWATKLTAKK